MKRRSPEGRGPRLPSARPLSYQNPEFLRSTAARPFRILAEYLDPLDAFCRENVQETIVFFGSARITPEGPLGRYYEEARALAHQLTLWSQGLSELAHRYIVCTGGGPGIMEAANRGAREAGGKTIGLNIRLPFEQGANPFITEGLHFEFHYFFMRKFWFAYLSKALVIFPGGFGTCDELFEILTLVQTDKLSKKIGVILYGREYWDEVLNVKPMAEWGAIADKDVELLHYADTPADAFDQLRRHLEEHHIEPDKPAKAPGLAITRG